MEMTMTDQKRMGLAKIWFLCLLAVTSAAGARDSSIPKDLNDKKWLQFMEVYGFKTEHFSNKLPLLAADLSLNPADQQEVANLFSDHSDEKFMSRVASSPGIRGSSQDASLDPAQSKAKQNEYYAMEDQADAGPAETLGQVRLVRERLGPKDADFLFWFYVEKLIDQEEQKAYEQNKGYSADELTEKILTQLTLTPEFMDFKARKRAALGSDSLVEAYFSGWRLSIEKRVLLQGRLAKR